MKIDDFFIDSTLDLNWDYIMTIPEFQKLEQCQQNPKWHGEGNALIHTKKCIDYAISHLPTDIFIERNKLKLLAVLFHDIGKTNTTSFFKGAWHSYNHEIAGEKIARRILWDLPFHEREYICSLIRWHMSVLDIFERKDYIEAFLKLSGVCDIKALIFLKRCDCNGSEPMDISVKQESNSKLDYLQMMAKYSSISIAKVFPWEKKKSDSTIYVMIGLPGAGKDTYINKTFGDKDNIISISRDKIRIELRYCQEGEKYVGSKEEEGNVTEIFNERLRECLKNKQDVIINNINLKKEHRDAYKKECACYNVKWIYIYIEAPTFQDNLERRKGQIPKKAMEEMREKLDWPQPSEYDSIIIEKNSDTF